MTEDNSEDLSALTSPVGSRMRKLDEFTGNIEKLDKSCVRKIEETRREFEKYKKPHVAMLNAVLLEIFGFIDDYVRSHNITEQKSFAFKAGTIVYGQDKFSVFLSKSRNRNEEAMITESIKRLRRLRKKEARKKTTAE